MAGSTIPRVAITGIGVVSPFGVGRDCFWRHVRRGCSGTRAIVDFDASAFPCTVAAPVPPVTIDDATPIDGHAPHERGERAGHSDPRRYSRASLIAVIAATEAWADAGLRLNEPGAGVLVGTFSGCDANEDAEPERRLAHVLVDRLADLGVPVLAGAPIGHQGQQWTLPVGARATLDSRAGTLPIEQGPGP